MRSPSTVSITPNSAREHRQRQRHAHELDGQPRGDQPLGGAEARAFVEHRDDLAVGQPDGRRAEPGRALLRAPARPSSGGLDSTPISTSSATEEPVGSRAELPMKVRRPTLVVARRRAPRSMRAAPNEHAVGDEALLTEIDQVMQTEEALEISQRVPTFAPSARYQGRTYRVAKIGCSRSSGGRVEPLHEPDSGHRSRSRWNSARP